jgi:general nucleoside transport system permease protein
MNTSVSPVEMPSRGVKVLRIVTRVIGSAAGFILLLTVTFLALRVPPLEGLRALWVGAFGDSADGHWYPISETLVKTAPLLLTGLGVSIAWRTGMFSIGGEGQLILGAIAATLTAKLASDLPGPLLTLLMLIVGAIAGAAWGWLAGWLRVRRNVQEVISTIMLNYVAIYLLSWLVDKGPLQEAAKRVAQSDPLPAAVQFARLVPPAWSEGIATRLHSGVLLAFLIVPIVWLLLFRTRSGFGMRVVGQNPDAARTARYNIDSLRLRSMAISGALCGLAGVIELLGITGRLYANFSPGWGFTAIPVALLGSLHPVGTLFSALFFGALTAGSGNLARFSGVSSVLIYILQAVAVLAVVGLRAWRVRRSNTETD